MTVELIKADLQHCRYLYDLYALPEVLATHGLKRPVPAADWRRLIEGVWDGWRDIWVLRLGETLVGHAGLQNRDDLDRRTDVVITVDPSCRQRGVGRDALEQVIRFCDGQNLDTLISRVMFGNEASLALFSGAGFHEVGRIPRYYRTGDGVFSQVILVRHRMTETPTATVVVAPKPAVPAASEKPKPVKPIVRSTKAKARVRVKGVRRKKR